MGVEINILGKQCKKRLIYIVCTRRFDDVILLHVLGYELPYDNNFMTLRTVIVQIQSQQWGFF